MKATKSPGQPLMLFEDNDVLVRVSYSDGLWSAEEPSKPAEKLNFCDFKKAVAIGIKVAVIKHASCVLQDQKGVVRKVFSLEDFCRDVITKVHQLTFVANASNYGQSRFHSLKK